jgi:hypothetical protein
MNPILEQIRFMNRIVGLGKLRKMRKKHSVGLKFVRGYVVTHCLWTLMNAGFLDELLEKEDVNVKEFAERNGLSAEVLPAVCEYLDGIRVLNFENGR